MKDRAYATRYYAENREQLCSEARERYAGDRERQVSKSIIRTKQRYVLITSYVNEIKRGPCSDCGGAFDPVCMDFDHRPGEVKYRNVAHLRYNLDAVKAEIAKCDLVCANCHRIRTYRQRNHRSISGRKNARPIVSDLGGEA